MHSPAPGSFNREVNATRLCLLEGCERPHYGLGYCSRHHRRFKLYGDPLAYAPPKPEPPRPTHAEVLAEMRDAYARAQKEVAR